MANIDNAYTVDILSLDDNVLIVSGTIDPSITTGYEAPVGSIYLRTDGTMYQKNNTANIDWNIVGSQGPGSGTDELLKISNNDTTAGFLNGKLVVGSSLTLVENNDGSNETLTIDTSIPLINLQTEINSIETASGGIFNSTGNFDAITVDTTLQTVINPLNLLDTLSQMDAIITSNSAPDVVSILDAGILVPNTPHHNLNFRNNFTLTDNAGTVDIDVDYPVFGTEYFKSENLGLSTSTSTFFLNKNTLTVNNLAGGVYRIGISYGWNHNNRGNDFEARIQENGINIVEIHKQEPKDSAGNFGNSGTSQRHYISRTIYRTLLPATSYTYNLDFRTDTVGRLSGIWDTIIEFWRVE